MTIPNDYTDRLRLAHDYMQKKGWAQGTEQGDNGSVCLTGAIRLCAPQNGDEYLIRGVLRHLGRAEEWNDDDERTEEEVLDYLCAEEITDADLEVTFGPNWSDVVRLVREAATLTPGRARMIQVVQVDQDAARVAAQDAARVAAQVATRNAARDAAQDAAWDAAQDATRNAAQGAAWDAALAVVVSDLISKEHFDLLMGPWRAAFPDWQ